MLDKGEKQHKDFTFEVEAEKVTIYRQKIHMDIF